MVLGVMNMLKMPIKALSSTLKEITIGMQIHGRYITSKQGEPPVSNRIQACAGSTEPHRKRCAIHALARADVTGDVRKFQGSLTFKP